MRLRDEASGFWSELHEDTRNYLEQIIESEEAWQEVQEARKEALTKTDFDSFYNGFVSMLSDMDATSEDFADSFEKYLQNAIFPHWWQPGTRTGYRNCMTHGLTWPTRTDFPRRRWRNCAGITGR